MDNTSEIINDWYELMQDNHVGVQPKAATLLKQVLDRYVIEDKQRNVWDEFMTIKAGEFDSWYRSLTSHQQTELNVRRSKAREEYYSTGYYNNPNKKDLLKG